MQMKSVFYYLKVLDGFYSLYLARMEIRKMKAVFIKGHNAVSVDDVKVPDLASAGDVLVKMRACGLCGSDLEKALHVTIVSLSITMSRAILVITAFMVTIRCALHIRLATSAHVVWQSISQCQSGTCQEVA